ncbi:O-antigen ligase family protein [Arthrobacter dokdonensis]|uniref:O-antigen ligase family protein n=1 Tax=Arthrobacter dokdonellae TaxID=2211210 RepID=UPI001013C8FB|nr:O-antigen ligase family protein [Arthrobacter dokdonellae]
MTVLKDYETARNRGHAGAVYRIKPPDAVTVLTIYLVLLIAIPSDQRVGALGGAGAPAGLFAVASLLWWGWHHLRHPQTRLTRRLQPVRICLVVFCGAVLASYTVASLSARPDSDIGVADNGLIRVAAFAGVLLVANDGIPNHERFILLVRRLSLLGGLYALLGLVQFFSGLSLVDMIQIPGLTASSDGEIVARAGFVRAAATASHPLEYAMVLVMALPFCLTVAIYDKKRAWLLRWFPVAAITLSSVLSVTRSALLGLAAVILILVPTWPSAVRRVMLASFGVVLVMVYVLVPGMMGTIIGMFSGEDSSVASRTDGYGTALAYIGVSPLFGRGFGTFLPSYRILDNQYLGSAIELGLVGLAAFFSLLLLSVVVSFRGRRRQRSPVMRAMGAALAASLIGGAMLTAFFDCFAFPQACGMLFLVIGMCGSYWNLARHPELDTIGGGT